ncbi:MAG TPA: secretin N-terminal domain-containing protein [Albitalea sp.]|uniref:secretin N-terminal domain-containing protein n=1 Tax=Piscinibacter sp. TaxID=1903157 RepID=UPI002ED29D84
MNTPPAALALASLLALTGCATPPPAQQTLPPTATLDRIQDELRAAQRDTSRPATRPDAVDRALLPPLQSEPPRPPAAPEPRFDLAVANAPAQQVFLQIVSGTKYSMLVPPELSGTIAINLKNVTVREALDSLRDLYGYEYRMQGTRIFIQPNTLQTRIFQVNYLAGKRKGATDMRVTSGSISASPTPSATSTSTTPAPNGQAQGSAVQSSRIATESDNDFWGELRDTLAGIVGTEGNRKVIVNPLSGVIAVRGFPADLRNAENYLRMTQLIIERQVMIEAKIIEVQLSDSFASGVNWSVFRSSNGRLSGGQLSPGTTLAPVGQISTGAAGINGSASSLLATAGTDIATDVANSGSLFGLAFQAHNFAALLQFLETQGNVQVLSSPRIATINNQKAVLKVGTDEFFVTSVTTNTTTGTGGTTNSPTIGVQPFFSGIALDVTPQIDENDAITLHLHPSVSVVAEKQKNVNLGSLGNFQLPLAASTVNESDSVVRVQDGNIVAIGGLMKQQQSSTSSGLPGAVEQPVVGNLFGQKSRSGSKSELVILLKPTIIRGERGWQPDVAELQERLQTYGAVR